MKHTEKKKEVIPVRVAKLTIGPISRKLSGSGTLRGRAEVEVQTELAGLVTEILCRKGQQVKQGQVLARLDDRLLQVELQEAKVGYEDAKARQSKAEYALREHAHVIERARLTLEDAKVAKIKAGLSFSESKRELGSKLKLPEGSLSKDELERVRLARDHSEQEVARARLAVMQKTLDLTSAMLKKGDLNQDLRDAKRQVARSSLSVQKALLAVDRTQIKAPIAGMIYNRELEPGQRISAGQVVFRVVDQSWFYLDLRMPEAELPLLALDQRVRVTTQSLFSPVRGRIVELEPSIDPRTGTVGVRIQIPDSPAAGQRPLTGLPADFMLRRGMFVRAQIEVMTHPQAKLIKQEALIYQDQQAYVYTVRDKKAKRIAVRLGFARENAVEIFAPELAEGAPIVIVGQRTVKDGTPVRMVPATPRRGDSGTPR